MAKQEFSVAGQYRYDRRSPRRWIASHLWRHRWYLAVVALLPIISNAFYSYVQVATGNAFNAVLDGAHAGSRLLAIALTVLALVLTTSAVDAFRGFCSEVLGKRFTRDAREELYLSLLGKSQTFHNRQRVGEIMARATNDVGLLSDMIVPGLESIIYSTIGLVIPIIFIGFVKWQLLAEPLLFTVAYVFALRDYMRRIRPVAEQQRAQFGGMNTMLAETVTGIEVVKVTAQEAQERHKFGAKARRYRDFYVANGDIQARYLPPLLLAIATLGLFLHGLVLISQHVLSVGGLITCVGLMSALRFVAGDSFWMYSLVGLGMAAARRILGLIDEETELDEEAHGFAGVVTGEIVFDHVSFGYGGTPVLRDLSFRIAPGQTVAIVGQTGAGKTTLTRLVNRIYDVDAGRVLIDGVDVREWSLASLRSQISTIEQDIFLFSRTVADNIGFGVGGGAERQAVERAARDAQAHDFITNFKDGYETMLGERGITLSGGQRQRVAIARALLTDPHILIMDDSTSAIDSATEDEIQRAMREIMRGRTTLLITHRLAQIRRADQILVLQQGRLIDQGSHEELLARCDLYRRIFAHDGRAVPELARA